MSERPVIFELADFGGGSDTQHPEARERIRQYLRASKPLMEHGDILSLILSREFNYQSRSQVAHLLPEVSEKLSRGMAAGEPLKFYLDLGGGYHAATMPDYSDGVSFGVSAAELLLIRQVMRFRQQMQHLYAPGILFHLLIDNGVAHVANGIAVKDTLNYCQRFESLITQLGAQDFIRIIPQTSLGEMMLGEIAVPDVIPQEQHHNVERFMGRAIPLQEACLRVGTYIAAEAAWERQVRALMEPDAIRFLQRADGHHLTFRPFPGGAARVQCGRIGFKLQDDSCTPVLVTTATRRLHEVIRISVEWE